MYAGAGAVGLIVAALVDPDLYRRSWRWIFGGTIAAIVLVYLQGQAVRGSKRWVDLGFFKLQPSEFGKLLFVVALAGFIAERGRRVQEANTLLTRNYRAPFTVPDRV